MAKKQPHRPKDMNQLAKMIVDLATNDDCDESLKKAPKQDLSIHAAPVKKAKKKP
jgi:hypothetical protein